jgi:hypothetical protein
MRVVDEATLGVEDELQRTLKAWIGFAHFG